MKINKSTTAFRDVKVPLSILDRISRIKSVMVENI